MDAATAAAAVTAKAVAVAEAASAAVAALAAYADALASAEVVERGVMVSCCWLAAVFTGLTHGRLTAMEEGVERRPGAGSSGSIGRMRH